MANTARSHARKRGVPATRSGRRYIGQTTIARHLGVTGPAVSNWLAREYCGPPQPDAVVDDVPIWLEDRLPEWKRWFRQLP